MKTRILGLSGQMAVGKSELSELIAEKLGWTRISTREVLLAEGHRRGFEDPSRKLLQDLGQEWVMEDIGGFCSSLLKTADWIPGKHLVIDSIRHTAVIGEVEKLTAPCEFRLAFVFLDEDVRRSRLRAREPETELSDLEGHPVESETSSILAEKADILVDGSNSPEMNVMKIARCMDD